MYQIYLYAELQGLPDVNACTSSNNLPAIITVTCGKELVLLDSSYDNPIKLPIIESG